ncbi:MAG: MoaD/ThiS family protein [Alphaproteobacteria bacterium]|nr:MoaD/ThiS family protein [Rhodospirillales bacterium]MCW9045356.1 MoaD/ThiS family protein [Alphaproteobacteria bacterium]
MKVTFKLYALLGDYLPEGAEKNQIDLDVAEGSSPMDLIKSYNLPLEFCHLVLVNGVYIEPSERENHILVEGDALAIWPPVAGG